jgi:hypothetical protein
VLLVPRLIDAPEIYDSSRTVLRPRRGASGGGGRGRARARAPGAYEIQYKPIRPIEYDDFIIRARGPLIMREWAFVIHEAFERSD